MASTRAPAVAEVLWELKRADKVATFSTIANRAGFSAGASGRAMVTCLKSIRKDWPHLQWWRAIRDDKTVKEGGEQVTHLVEWGVEVETEGQNGRISVLIDETKMMSWDEQGQVVTSDSAAAE